MKTRKSGLLQRLTAVLLAAVLVVGMTSNAVPNTVLAQEDAASSVSDGWQESTEGNTEEPAEGNTKPEEKAPAPVETTNPEEPKQETPAPEEEPKQETSKPEQGTVSGNDAQPQDGDHVNLYDVMPVNEVRTARADTGYAYYSLSDLMLVENNNVDISGNASEGVQLHFAEQSAQVTYEIPKEVVEAGLTECTCLIAEGNVGDLALKFLDADMRQVQVEDGKQNISVTENADGIKHIGFMNNATGERDFVIDGIIFSAGKDIPCKLTVNGGTGSGEYKVGTVVPIKADVPESGKQFDRWVLNRGYITLNDPTKDTTALLLWGPVEVTATYKDIAEEHEHDGVTFTPWTGTSSLPDTPGNYYLTKDVTLSDPWHLPGGGQTTTLCLNGKTIRTSGTGCVIYILLANRLNLYDCRDAGKITGGKSSGVFVMADGSFHMYGGKISGNQASGDGGGVSVVDSTFHMYGGEISGNQASNNGGGVYVRSGAFVVGGSAVISGNTSNGAASNVYLSNGRTITAASDNPLSGTAKIGVTTETAPTEGNPVNVTGHNKGDYSSYFTSDNPAYEIVNANDVVQLALKSETPSESGTVTPEVKPGENAPETNISTPAEDLREMLLTDEEKRQVQNGTDVKIILEVKDAGSTVSESDKAAIQQDLNGFTVGQYLNIDLYKLVGADQERKVITETPKKIKIVITVPDSLKNTDSKKTRTFAVIRVHNGNAELLTDLDNDADTITIETDRFSTYAIVYKDTANGGSGDGGDDDNGGGSGDGGGNSGGGDNGSGGDNNGGSDNGNGSAYNNGGSSNNGAGNNNNGGTGSGVGSAKNSSQNNAEKITVKQGSAKDNEPKTGDNTPLELSATLAMIAGFAYLLLYFTDRERGMTEETKKELVSRLVGWARQGGRFRRYLALAAIFVLLVYYHSIGKKTCVRWKAIYGE